MQHDIDELSKQLYSRIQEETEKFLHQQFDILGLSYKPGSEHLKKVDRPEDPIILADYYYKNIPLLRVQCGLNSLGVEFLLTSKENLLKYNKDIQGDTG